MAKKVNRIDVYKEAAALAKAPLPKDPMRTGKLIDGVVWDGKDPKALCRRFQDQGARDMEDMSRRRSMSSIALRKKDAFAVVAPPAPHQPAAPVGRGAHGRARRAAGAPCTRATGYRRAQAPDWLLQAVASVLGFALFVCAVGGRSPARRRMPGPVGGVARGGDDLLATRSTRRARTTRASAGTCCRSLKRVGIGFGLAALVGIPLGFLIGRFRFLSDMAAPIISLLRPVSPLAWLPIGLLRVQGGATRRRSG